MKCEQLKVIIGIPFRNMKEKIKITRNYKQKEVEILDNIIYIEKFKGIDKYEQ